MILTTPQHMEQAGQCNPNGYACGSMTIEIPAENYMSGSDDECAEEFVEEQYVRMSHMVGEYRYSLGTAPPRRGARGL